jgi:hypothetical protein
LDENPNYAPAEARANGPDCPAKIDGTIINLSGPFTRTQYGGHSSLTQTGINWSAYGGEWVMGL